MSTYDAWKTTEPPPDEPREEPEAAPEPVIVKCQCRVCGAFFEESYESFLCDPCVAKPYEKPDRTK